MRPACSAATSTRRPARRRPNICAINILAQAKAALGDLEKIRRLVKITVFVASTPDFTEQHLVANGASDFLVAVLGERGKHARSAVGTASLPLNAAVEIEAIIEVAERIDDRALPGSQSGRSRIAAFTT